jgi:hypothetical protein
MAVLVTIMVSSCKHIKCGSCGGVKLKRGYIGVTLNEICSGKCLAAQKDACECKCKGKFHRGNNSQKLNELLNPKKKKPAVKKAKKKKVEIFEPESLKDELALFIQRKRFKTSSFDRYSDPNYRKDAKTLALNWLSPKGQSLDQAAADFIRKYEYNVDSNDIIDLITEIIINYPSGIKQYVKDAKYNQYLRDEDEAEKIKQSFYSNTDYNDFDLQERVRQEDEEYFKNYKEPALVFGTRNMKLKKGSAAAKAFMAKIRAKKGTAKKPVSKHKDTKSHNVNIRVVSGTKSVYKYFIEYLYRGLEVREKFKTIPTKKQIIRGVYHVENKYGELYPLLNTQTLSPVAAKLSGWKRGNTRMIEKGEKPFKTQKTILVKRRIATKPKGAFKSFTNIIGALFDPKTIKDLDDLKQEYRKLANKYHPDKGGSTAQFQELQNEYEKLRNKILSGSSLSEAEKENEIIIDEALRAAINAIITLEGIKIELIGKWIWVSGNTFPVYKQIKSAGFEFIKKKGVPYWIYKGVESKSRGGTDMADIVKKYGSKDIKPTGPSGKKLNGVKNNITTIQKNKLKTALNKLVKGMNKRPL